MAVGESVMFLPSCYTSLTPQLCSQTELDRTPTPEFFRTCNCSETAVNVKFLVIQTAEENSRLNHLASSIGPPPVKRIGKSPHMLTFFRLHARK